jgi:hypothetical protein
MTLLPRCVKVHLAFGFVDMRKGIERLGHQLRDCDHRTTGPRRGLNQRDFQMVNSRSASPETTAFFDTLETWQY